MIKPKKELGQNFLQDLLAANLMVDSLGVAARDVIVEIGPGLGAVTDVLSKKLRDEGGGSKLYAIEFDRELVDKLKARFPDGKSNKIEIVNANILDWLPNFQPGRDFKLIGSLPYNITSPLLHSVVRLAKRPEACVFLVQKEVAQKVCAQAPKANYLSTFMQTFFVVELIEIVDRTKFNPVPAVDGGVIKLVCRSNPSIQQGELKKYEGFLHKGFSSPRKMLNKVFTADQLKSADIDGRLRPQNLTVDQWRTAFKVSQ